jgi:hypothetical protein
MALRRRRSATLRMDDDSVSAVTHPMHAVPKPR